MTKENKQNYDNFNRALMRFLQSVGKDESLSNAKRISRYLATREGQLKRLAVMQCDGKFYNKYWKNGVNPEQEHLEALTLAFIKKNIGCDAYTQRDPRGMMVRLQLKTPATHNYYNNFDGETSGVDWIDYY